MREAWLNDSLERREALPLDEYDVMSDIAVEGRGIPWNKQDASAEALESFMAEVTFISGIKLMSCIPCGSWELLHTDSLFCLFLFVLFHGVADQAVWEKRGA